MCFSFESSLTAWIISNAISLYLFNRNKKYDRWLSGFITVFSTVQLLEAGLWCTKSKDINSLLTKLIFIALLLQPLVQTYLGSIYTGSNILFYMSFVFLGLLIWGILRCGKYYSTIGPNGHQVWRFKSGDHTSGLFGGSYGYIAGLLYLIGIFVPLLFLPYSKSLPLIGVGLLTLLYSLYNSSTGEFGSLWCFTAVFYSIISVIV